MCYNAKRGENMKLAIDAMSGDLGSSIVVEACRSFLEKNKTDELYVVGKIEELEALKEYQQVTLIDARETFEMTENILAIRRKKESSRWCFILWKYRCLLCLCNAIFKTY